MKNIKVSVGTSKAGSTCKRIIEVDDDATEDEINELAWETACEMIDFEWEEVATDE